MTPEQKQRFKVITNPSYSEKTDFKEKKRDLYQTNPLTEKLAKFVNNEAGPKFSIEDLLKW